MLNASVYRLVLFLEGHGAYSILKNEAGLHVYDDGSSPGTTEEALGRNHGVVRVSVVPQPVEPPNPRKTSLRDQALETLRQSQGEDPRIVRRYQDGKTPLARDHVRQWSTEDVQLVLDGNFDLLPLT